jgi:hypothetical protein
MRAGMTHTQRACCGHDTATGAGEQEQDSACAAHSDELPPHAPALARRWPQPTQVPDVQAAYAPFFEGFETDTEGSWAAVTAVRKAQ